MSSSNPAQSAWSDNTNPRSNDRLVLAPPTVDLFENSRLRLPLIYRQSKSAFRHKCMTTNGFKWRDYSIILDLVIPANDANFTARFQPHLRGSQNVPRRMKRNVYS